ncbi:hypothetical protein C2S52_023265 [Perilla frutescens var. hirtella]|nr:hypothetical protein C2S52_023265 [Perilla frutescens var. hirtella]
MTLGHAIESCTLQLRSLRPFDETLGSNSAATCAAAAINGPCSKRICGADRAASFSFSSVWDLAKLSLFHGDKHFPFPAARGRRFARKRRRRGSRSVSSRSSNRRCLSANGACSDFMVAAGSTDSSGELFGEGNWASDVSERNLRREKEGSDEGEREFVISGYGMLGSCEIQVNESGYGSEPGYRGDVELEYGDELDEEEDDRRALFWGEECGENTSQLEMVGENSLQRGHHRCRRKKHDLRMADALG